ncbi:hypothetical protein C5E10_06250 [Pseudoclavibacter sp. RFBG4]|uniref:hypothetical protein n=1 Tax=Pseudoclavibacter sp. RFBG4 TaxID=2080575 RepID=UPI000CE8BBBA|nr:hypothetical protein [Pseudoclavibacter sp. RFBG4]PPG35189.1 hypothetical protein C5E10_06250 [Pseudoclavibacter sp. RFBG4]
MISASDLASPEYERVPDEAKPTAFGLWLHLDPLGRGPMDPEWIAARLYPTKDRSLAKDLVFEHLVLLLDAGFMSTYQAEGSEWICLSRPLKVDMRGVKIFTPDPPGAFPWTLMAGERGGASGRESARERARAEVRAEGAARADAWAAAERDRVRVPRRPERPLVLDAPPPFCPEHMPYGSGGPPCGPCRDARIVRHDWMETKVYEQRLTDHYEREESDDWDLSPI